LVFLNVPTMQQTEAYVGYVHKLFDEHGNPINDDTRKFLQQFMQAFANWSRRSDLGATSAEALQQARAITVFDQMEWIGRIFSNSSRHASLKPRNRSIVPSIAISRSSTKLLSGSK
jgi:hypothetical protein